MEIRVREKRPSFKRKRDNYARKLKRKKLINYLREQISTSTVHGLPYIVNTEIHWFERLFWGFCFTFCIYIIFVLLVSQFKRYKSAPIVTSVEMDYFNWNISFPAISLCPAYKIDDVDLSMLVNETLSNSGVNVESHLKRIASVSMDSIGIADNDLELNETIISPRDYGSFATLLFKKFDNNSLTTSTDWPVSVEVAMSEMGLCHVINSNVAGFDNPEKGFVTKYEKKNIDLSVHEKQFFIQFVNYDNLYKVYIHGPDEIVISTTPSYIVKAKSYIHFGVQVFSTRISDELRSTPISLRKCRFTNEPISERYPVYSYNHCIIDCRIKMILQLCDCIPHLYKALENEPICNVSQWNCFAQYRREIMTLSASDETAKKFSYADLPRSPKDCNCLSECESDVYRKDHETVLSDTESSRLKISISSYPKVRVVKDTIINVYDIILRSGGVMNLCIGASMISLLEIIITITKLLWYIVTTIGLCIYVKLRKTCAWLQNWMKKIFNVKQQLQQR